MTSGPREPADVERDVDSDNGSEVEQEDDGDRSDAVIGADDTGMIRDERDIFEGERAEADEESSSS
jgi:hypothetical protein